MPKPLRVAVTLEQCWHDVPGGTAVAILELARRLHHDERVEVVGVAGRHRRSPAPPFTPPVPVRSLPLGRPLLYETWNRWDWPRVERVTGAIDVCHSTTVIPAATRAPHVVTVHDVAFVLHPDRFTRQGVRSMTAGLERCRAADRVICPSAVVREDLAALGFDRDRLRVVPWGVDGEPADAERIDEIRARLQLPDRFVLFVGTLEPRKNLQRLVRAVHRMREPLPLVVAGADGWGDVADRARADAEGVVVFLGFVAPADLAALYGAASAFAYPSESEGFGLPVAEAMAHGAPVVTSAGTATEEIAGGAAELVDPFDVDDIARGLDAAIGNRVALIDRGARRAAALSWDAAVEATVAVYRELVA